MRDGRGVGGDWCVCGADGAGVHVLGVQRDVRREWGGSVQRSIADDSAKCIADDHVRVGSSEWEFDVPGGGDSDCADVCSVHRDVCREWSRRLQCGVADDRPWDDADDHVLDWDGGWERDMLAACCDISDVPGVHGELCG